MRDAGELLEAWARGDSEALGELLQRHLPGLRGFIRLRMGGLLRSKEDSGDLVQSVCREILQHGDRFRHPSEEGFRRWLYTTALRKVMNRAQHYRAARRDAALEVPADSPAAEAELLDCYGSFCTPSRVVAAREEVARIEALFEELPADYREVITLARIARLSRAAIAGEMGRTEKAVRDLLYLSLIHI